LEKWIFEIVLEKLLFCYNKPTDIEYTIEIEQETDGRWVAEVDNLHGVLTYGDSRVEAFAKAQTLALHIEAEKLKNGKRTSFKTEFSSQRYDIRASYKNT
jgi:predicted RNase H-like HicB family nuclease